MKEFNPEKMVWSTIENLKNTIKSDTVLVAVSGGVDSATTAKMLLEARVKVQSIFIDTGFMRKNESVSALKLLKMNGINTEIMFAQRQFFTALSKVDDPREKRLVFRKVYFEIIEKYLRKNKIVFLAQGSQSKKDILKRNYHNVSDNEYINSKITKIEPLLGLSKLEIRQMARKLDFTKDLSERPPFPGPGLLIRFGGRYSPEKLKIIQEATEVVERFKAKYQKEFVGCFQVFPYLVDGSPVSFIDQSFQTSLGSVILIRAVTLQGVVYRPFILPVEIFQKLTDNLMKIKGIARVCLDMTPKNGTIDKARHGATIEYE